MTISTAVTELLGIRHPIILAPMGGVAGGKLAAAVSQAGGFGIIGGGYGNPKAGYGGHDYMEREFRAAGNARVGVGYITWSLAQFPELLDQALDRKPAAFFLSFGEETLFARRIKDAGAILICQVHDVAGARHAADAGADIIVAQGTEAGGHGTQKRATLALVPAVVDAVKPVPVLAAGGIADGRGLAASLLLGASGVLVGTRFWATPEALGHGNVKSLLTRSSGDDTMRTGIFDIVRELDWPAGYSGRALANDLTARWHGSEEKLASHLELERERFWTAMQDGDVNTAVVFAGEGVDLVREIKPASEVVLEISEGAEALLRNPPNFVLSK